MNRLVLGLALLATAAVETACAPRAEPGRAAYERGDFVRAEAIWREHATPRRERVAWNGRTASSWVTALRPASAQAQFELAGLYLEAPEGIEPRPEEAVRLLTRAADRGHAGAIAKLARIYREGVLAPADPELARRYEAWLRQLGVRADEAPRD